MKRTWFLPISGRPPFRNCLLIRKDMGKPVNRLPWRQAALRQEWEETFRRGVMQPGSEFNPAEPGPHDEFISFDDSDEATDRWIQRFLESHGKSTSG